MSNELFRNDFLIFDCLIQLLYIFFLNHLLSFGFLNGFSMILLVHFPSSLDDCSLTNSTLLTNLAVFNDHLFVWIFNLCSGFGSENGEFLCLHLRDLPFVIDLVHLVFSIDPLFSDHSYLTFGLFNLGLESLTALMRFWLRDYCGYSTLGLSKRRSHSLQVSFRLIQVFLDGLVCRPHLMLVNSGSLPSFGHRRYSFRLFDRSLRSSHLDLGNLLLSDCVGLSLSCFSCSLFCFLNYL